MAFHLASKQRQEHDEILTPGQGRTQGWPRGSLISGGRHRRSVELEGSGGMLLQNFFINLIEYGVSFCILIYSLEVELSL